VSGSTASLTNDMKTIPCTLMFALLLAVPFAAGAEAVGSGAPDQIAKTIRQYFKGLAHRDLNTLREALNERFVIVAAARQNARVGILDTSKPVDILPRNDDWDHVEVTSVHAQISSTHPTVAMAAFTLKLPFRPDQIAAMEDALNQRPDAFTDEEKKMVEKRIAERAVSSSLFAMLALTQGNWKIVSVSLPH
jgi:hypothetical protein